MRHNSSLQCRPAFPLALAALAAGAVAAPAGADAARGGCVAPDVAGVSLAQARAALRASGCALQTRQLPAHGEYVTPAAPDGRQLVARQSPRAGTRTGAVTIWLKPLCSQPAEPGPARRGPVSSRGPTELIAGLFLRGGPRTTGPHCRRGTPIEATMTVTTPGGEVVARRVVRSGRYGVFPLKPGSYVLAATPAAGGGQRPASETVTISTARTTRLNLVDEIS